MELHKDKYKRIDYMKKMHDECLRTFNGDVELARVAYKRIMFEEGKSY